MRFLLFNEPDDFILLVSGHSCFLLSVALAEVLMEGYRQDIG
jgi:hypothetical protein